MERLKPVLQYPGQKWRIAPWIAAHLPPHECYVEPFAGSLAVLFAKEPSANELVNDRCGRIINLFRCLRDQPEPLIRAVALTPWARDEYEAADEPTGEPVEDARRFLVRCWQGIGSTLPQRTGWKLSRRSNRPMATVWCGLPERLAQVAARLQGVQIENRPALDVLARYAAPEVCLYCDPPYPRQTRTRNHYLHEMDERDHRDLLAALMAHPGPVLLSTYPNELYRQTLAGWTCLTRRTNTTGQSEMVEELWLNERARRQQAGGQPTLALLEESCLEASEPSASTSMG